MNISTSNAMQIVNEISEIIHQHVNMMDENGIIIASTDVQRVGTYHEGAAKVIAEHLNELIIQTDDDYSGTKKGINLPILLRGEIAGVVGITGDRDKVVKYGRVIKKMTEILLLENSLAEQKKIDARIKNRFLDKWVFENNRPYPPSFTERGMRLGIDVSLPRRVMVAEIEDLKKYSDNSEGQRLIDNVNQAVCHLVEENPNNIFTKTSSQMIALVHDCTDKEMRNLAERIQQKLLALFRVAVNIGIDDGSGDIHRSYLKAKKALFSYNFLSEASIKLYNDLNLELFMNEISVEIKEKYVHHMFRNAAEEDIESSLNLLKVYFMNDGSINKTAELLFMHKNTLQYKLKKIHEQTGYDPRRIIDAALFFLAIQFYQEIMAKKSAS